MPSAVTLRAGDAASADTRTASADDQLNTCEAWRLWPEPASAGARS